MAVDLTPDPVDADLAARTADLVRRVLIPVEEKHGGVVPSEGVRLGLQNAARSAGVFAPHVSPPETHRRSIARRVVRRHTGAVST